MVGEQFRDLLEQPADNRIYADIEGDLWQAATMSPTGWVMTHRGPFTIHTQPMFPTPEYGPYTVVLDGC